jgi:exosortase/archaeosortase family protein
MQSKKRNRKSPFGTILTVAAILLMVLPFISTVNEFMTAILLKWEAYRILENWVVPYEARLLAGIFTLFPVSVYPTTRGVFLNGTFLEIQWNCLGWQSAVLLLATFITGMQGSFKTVSRLETIVIGVLGTYLINFVRLALVGAFAINFGRVAAVVFHDYFSLLMLLVWFTLFWWFSFAYVLEEKEE